MSATPNPSPDPASGKRRNADATRQRLLDAALTSFSTQGYDASSTRQIETLAGVKRGLIGYHFGSKKALWVATADYIMMVAETEISSALTALENIEKEYRLRFFIRTYVSFCARHPEVIDS